MSPVWESAGRSCRGTKAPISSGTGRPTASAAFAAIDATNAALAVGRPVPLLIGAFVPRHYRLALSQTGDIWHVYEPTSGEVREVPVDRVRRSALADLLGFDRLSAVLLPS